MDYKSPPLNMRMRPTSTQIGLAFAAIYICWGSTYFAIRVALETLPPFFMGGIRFLIAGSLVCFYAWLRKFPKPSIKNSLSASLVGALLLLGGNGGVVWAEQRVPSSVTALIVAICPIFISIFGGWIDPTQKPTWKGWLGLFLACSGC